MPRRSLEVVAAALLALAFAFPASAQQLAQRAAMMQGLDKVTARVSTFPLEIDKPARFGTLEITLKACHKRPPEEPPESAAFLEIRELRRMDVRLQPRAQSLAAPGLRRLGAGMPAELDATPSSVALFS